MIPVVYGTMFAAFLMTVCSNASGTSLNNAAGVLSLTLATVWAYGLVAGAVWFSYIYLFAVNHRVWWASNR